MKVVFLTIQDFETIKSLSLMNQSIPLSPGRSADGQQLSLVISRICHDGNRIVLVEDLKTGIFSNLLVHLGERPCFGVSINNSTAFNLLEGMIKVELYPSSSSSQVVILYEGPLGILAPGQIVILETLPVEELREATQHSLSMTVQYKHGGSGEAKILRKLYKFPVIAPFILRTKASLIPAQTVAQSELAIDFLQNEIFILEAQLQNLSSSDFSLKRLALETIEPVKARTFVSLSSDFKEISEIIGDDCSQQFAFLVMRPTGAISALGRLTVEWSTNGEPGHLQTAPITFPLPIDDPIEVIIIPEAQDIKRGELLPLLIILQNKGQSDLSKCMVRYDCKLLKEAVNPQIIPYGLTDQLLGESLPAGNSTRNKITLLPLVSGLLDLNNILWIDYIEAGHEYRIQCRLQILVKS